MSEEEKEPEESGEQENALGKVDKFFSKMSGYVTKKVSAFVAFLFLLLGVGILIGYWVTLNAPEYIYFTMLAPLFLGLLSYYNRALAMALFLFFLVFLVLFG